MWCACGTGKKHYISNLIPNLMQKVRKSNSKYIGITFIAFKASSHSVQRDEVLSSNFFLSIFVAASVAVKSNDNN